MSVVQVSVDLQIVHEALSSQLDGVFKSELIHRFGNRLRLKNTHFILNPPSLGDTAVF